MNRETKIIAGSLAAAGIVGGLAVAGQYAGAAMFAKWEQLPESVVGIFTLHDYWIAYGSVPAVKKALAACTLVSAVVPLAPIGIAAMALFAKPKRELHGSARFAYPFEVRKSGLLDEAMGKPSKKPSILVGKYKDKYLTFAGQEFVLLAAPTRSGKGVGVVIPNLLTYPDSVVVLDVKGENFQITSKYRQHCGQKVFKWAPFDRHGCTHRWNPLEKIAKSQPHERVDALQSIGARLFHAPDPRHQFFYEGAADLFQAVALFLIETGRPCTFGEVLRQGCSTEMTLREHLAAMAATKGLSGDCLGALGRVMSAPDDTMGSITSTFNVGLRIFSNPSVDVATSASDFDVDQVRRQRMTIYLVLPVRRIAVAGVLANLLYSQLIDENMDAAPGEDPTIICQCLLLMDEASSIGKIPAIEKGSAFIAGYDMRLLTILQDKAQYVDVYGQHAAHSVIVNHGLKVIYPPKDEDESKALSESLGTFTMKSTSTSRNSGKSSSRGESTSDQRRELMLAQELRQMPKHEEIILGTNYPIRCEKAYFYRDAMFIDRLKSVSPLLRKLADAQPDKLPTQDHLDEVRRSGELSAGGIPVFDIARWHAEHSDRPGARQASRMLSSRELLELDAQEASGELLAATVRAMSEDLAELMPNVRADVSQLLAGLPALAAVAGEPEPPAADAQDHNTLEAADEHA
ncbi:type IV secretory system conjugative DNA transfer family protein [Burkholderia pseudomallei]|uniref:type IV secretory system conjugative DNA transfer family protein n=1 Tax=Burkholderia pseudomallei TaxID=28450 RepID=UPI000537A4A7|nr:type IV secretory system conjugative DNA transfer family protein [Burkholderia pseudomallei]KGX19033.1 type IV secretory system Conjugative DNA transfer family protein [Burkholderia pseudomallei ABCPW 1]